MSLSPFIQRFSALTLMSIALSTLSFSAVLAADGFLSRGEAVSEVVHHFQLAEKNKVFLDGCKLNIDECVFAFSARSHFEGIQTKPLILYPDVFPAYKYYAQINTASLMEVVMGYWDEPQSPFLPEREITKIEALKIVLGAANIYKWQDKNELITPEFTARAQQDNIYDKIKNILTGQNWWYYFYANYAQSVGIISQDANWNPEDKVTETDLQNYFQKADQIAIDNEKNHPSGNTAAQTDGAGS